MRRLHLVALVLSLDGALVAQQFTWQRLTRPRSYSPAMAHDLARQRTVLVASEDTFEWQNGRWAHRTYTPALQTHEIALAYDVQRASCVLFGGREAVYSDETWAYDGRAWVQLLPVASPSPRITRIAYDVVRARSIVFGGTTDETWEWDGVTWTLVPTVQRPPLRSYPGLAFDLVGGGILMFGGVDAGSPLADTWSWNGTTWLQRTTPVVPPARNSAAMACDLSRGRVVLFGGFDGSTGTVFGDTWEWDGTTWMRIAPSAHPSARMSSAMAFDVPSGRMLLFGGVDAVVSFTDTWSFDGNQWRLDVASQPTAALESMTTDHAHGHLVAFGVSNGTSTPEPETWTGDGVTWTRQFTPNSPSGRFSPMVGDEARQEILLFGGSSGVLLDETWAWNGTTWTQRFPASRPPAGYHAMAYDPTRQVVLLCETASGAITVWEWNGTVWSPRPALNRPSLRFQSSIAFDAARNRLVLFGGYFGVCGAVCGSVTNHRETWLWDGATWTQATIAQPPPARSSAMLAYDPDRQRLVLAGGVTMFPSGNQYLNFPVFDAWEWDGATWSSIGAAPAIHLRAAFEPHLRRIVTEAWTLTTAPNETAEYGAGCPGSLGVPWSTTGSATLGNLSFGLDVGAVPPNAACLVGLSFAPGATPIGASCSLLLGPLITLLSTTANSTGFATTPAPIPSAPVLRGLVVHAQALVLDAAAPAGFAMTQGLRIRVGD